MSEFESITIGRDRACRDQCRCWVVSVEFFDGRTFGAMGSFLYCLRSAGAFALRRWR